MMMPSRRHVIQSMTVHSTSNAGLWLDKYFDQLDASPKEKLVNEIAKEIQEAEHYPDFYRRWKESLEQFGADCREAQVQGRLAINLGTEAVLETAIALHHTYGVPYIPGSALKGVAAHYTKHLGAEWDKNSPAFEVLFGNPKTAGYVTFFDALYVPGSGYKGRALWPDVITVHHPDYYQAGRELPPPADWDSPNPIPFLSATGKYLIALAGPLEWVSTAFEILGLVLEKEGIGAKTSIGYGRMKFVSTTTPTQPFHGSSEPAESYALKKQRLLQEKIQPGRLRGTILDVHESGRYGKINPAGGGAPIFVHINQIKESNPVLRKGQVVEYQIGQYQGKDQAQNVKILLEPG